MTKKQYLINTLKKEIQEVEYTIRERILLNNNKFNFDYYDDIEFYKLMSENDWDCGDREDQNFDVGQLRAYKNALILIEKHVL